MKQPSSGCVRMVAAPFDGNSIMQVGDSLGTEYSVVFTAMTQSYFRLRKCVEFQPYTKYAEISPYVVIQDQTKRCRCVICNGPPDAVLLSNSHSPVQSNGLQRRPQPVEMISDGSLTDMEEDEDDTA